jgi:uncharacterized Zn finger protein (UPF0148 family)
MTVPNRGEGLKSMEERCVQHQFEPAADLCRNCGHEHCSECLVYAFGKDQAPYCVSCALAASGVRSNAARPPSLSRREIKRRVKERKKANTEKQSQAKVEVKVAEFDWVPAEQAAQSPEWLEEQFPRSGERVPF